ncbi:MAG TPA: MaoC/PaaZ C-terminal domain-containing protein [Candidatus Hydrogenedens sp.]|nr:MaoC/PaaZ C-terminal domain-containing protein [Candidatus Hydrogenedens sp.]HOL20673.1 MaoC/PaaZ C-terminal domain-containing protein [Candidatus Hydrogenedens sp.]HPP57977.1 MaoC/PaaZ C-terminal domain-containing protein [Candidatus Hydrogenedens sp.]
MSNELSSSFVGIKSRVLSIPISPRDSMKYSAGIHETNTIFYDDRNEPLLVHPMYAVALTWKISSQFSTYWDTADFPMNVLERQVHYLEELRWYRSFFVGETLHIQGEIKAVVPHLAGTLFWIDYTATDDKGEVVFIEGLGALLRDIKCKDEGIGKELFYRNATDLQRGEETMWEDKINVSVVDAHIYDACSEIHFPIHTSWAFAQKVGLPAPVYQGTATLSQVVRKFYEHDLEPPQNRIEYLYVRFSSFVYGGDELLLKVRQSKGDESNKKLYFFEVTTPRNDYAIKHGKIVFVS